MNSAVYCNQGFLYPLYKGSRILYHVLLDEWTSDSVGRSEEFHDTRKEDI